MAKRAVVHNTHVVHRRASKIRELRRRVASFACQSSRDMIDWFGYWRHTKEHLTVMACCTTTGDTSVIHHSRARTGTCRMTQRTSLGRRQMPCR